MSDLVSNVVHSFPGAFILTDQSGTPKGNLILQEGTKKATAKTAKFQIGYFWEWINISEIKKHVRLL